MRTGGSSMKYSVDPWVFEKNKNLCFGIIIGHQLYNSKTSKEDSDLLESSENQLRSYLNKDNLKTHPDFAVYRDTLVNVNINPNKYTNSVEAMSKRVISGGSLPRINALVDLCNAIALQEVISLGAHDLADIKEDLIVRLTKSGDKFLPFGSTAFEDVPEGELVFTSGNEIQTRQWLWRQSERGKITENSSEIFFQLVGFKGDHEYKFNNAMNALQTLIKNRFNGTFVSFVVDANHPEIEF
jgi:DNA/RNA-binding domain of Phe-tRNA-synthetase-like protein